jgi:hypothetical protein
MPHIWIRVKNTGTTAGSAAVGDRAATPDGPPVQRIDAALGGVGGRRERTFKSANYVYALARVPRGSRPRLKRELDQPGDDLSDETDEST